MSNIDLNRMITAEDKAAEAARTHAAAIKTECRAHILAVCNETAQINLAAAAAAGQLSPEQQAVFRAGLQWITDMRAACTTRIGNPAAEAGNWPPVPPGLAALAGRF